MSEDEMQDAFYVLSVNCVSPNILDSGHKLSLSAGHSVTTGHI